MHLKESVASWSLCQPSDHTKRLTYILPSSAVPERALALYFQIYTLELLQDICLQQNTPLGYFT